MSKLTRALQKIFGSTSASSELAVIGSLAAGSPAFSSDPVVQQSLPNYDGGWPDCVLGGNSPAIEDLNSVCYLYSRQLAYLFQAGIPEYDGSTTYFLNSIIQDGSTGTLYQAVYGSPSGFSGIAPPNGSYWAVLAGQSAFVRSASCGTFSTSGTSAVAVTNFSNTIVTNGRPVVLTIEGQSQDAFFGISSSTPTISGGGSITTISTLGFIQIKRDGSTVVSFNDIGFGLSLNTTGSAPIIRSLAHDVPASLYATDVPSAGTHTYVVEAFVIDTSNTLQIENSTFTCRQT